MEEAKLTRFLARSRKGSRNALDGRLLPIVLATDLIHYLAAIKVGRAPEVRHQRMDN